MVLHNSHTLPKTYQKGFPGAEFTRTLCLKLYEPVANILLNIKDRTISWVLINSKTTGLEDIDEFRQISG